MIFKKRQEPGELKLLRMLNARMELENEQHLQNLEKGYEGEVVFDGWLEKHGQDVIVINDLLLELGGTLFQIDSIVISPESVHLFEVKNFEGDYYMEKERWYSSNKTEVKDPLLQLRRSDSLFRRLLRDLGFSSSLESQLVFVNPEFQLYHCAPNLPIVFSSQLNRFSLKFKKQLSFGRLTARHIRIAEKLVSLHIEESPYKRLPAYRYEDLRKGFVCVRCGRMGIRTSKSMLGCKECKHLERIEPAIKRSIEEFRFLFPDKPVTTKLIFDWCGDVTSKKIIMRVLCENYQLLGHGKSARYVPSSQINEE